MPILVHLALIAVQVLFSSLAIAGKYVLGEVPPVVLVLARVTGAACVLLVVHRTSGAARVTDRMDLLRLCGLGILGIVANQTFFLLGLARTTAVNASVLVATVPVFTVLNAMLIREEAPNARKILGILAAAAGSVWLIGPGRLTLRSETAVGDLLILAGMYAYAQYLVLGKRMLRRYDPLTVTTYVMTFAAIGVLPLGLPALAHLDIGAVTPITWMWV
ncbi:MAG TPA: DMT family transporter, partial [Gemmatimonadales bacterium]|nr:DMT family transporter [Gemmatimonadales bacterium]